MTRLTGKKFIVTGAGGAIGSDIALKLALEGARILVADINEDAARAVVSGIREQGGLAEAGFLDLGNPDSIQAMVDHACELFGGFDGIVNNAAATYLARIDGDIEHMEIALWDETMRIDLRGTMLACKYAIPVLRANGGGAIVNISSQSALRGAAIASAYSAAKAGVIALSQYVAAQHGHEGIRCNAIAPGLILTNSTEARYGPVRKAILDHHLSPRLGQPSDIAWTVFYLVADEGAFVNGQCLSVDGGLLSHQRFWMDLPTKIAAEATGG